MRAARLAHRTHEFMSSLPLGSNPTHASLGKGSFLTFHSLTSEPVKPGSFLFPDAAEAPKDEESETKEMPRGRTRSRCTLIASFMAAPPTRRKRSRMRAISVAAGFTPEVAPAAEQSAHGATKLSPENDPAVRAAVHTPRVSGSVHIAPTVHVKLRPARPVCVAAVRFPA